VASVDRILPKELGSIWPEFTILLEAHPETWYTWWTVPAIRTRLEEGDAQLWIVEDEGEKILWYMTEIQEYPKRKILNVWWASGHNFLKCVPAVIPMLKTYAQHVGARSITMVGRPGFERWLRQHGVTVQTVTYQMEALNG
jgi:hypothetical protein